MSSIRPCPRVQHLVLSLLLLACPVFFARGEEPPPRILTLEACIELGLTESVSFLNAQRDLSIAEQNVRSVRAQVYPSLEANASYTRLDEASSISIPGLDLPQGKVDTYSAGVGAEQLLYSGGGVRAALRIATNYRHAATMELSTVTSDLRRRITRSFYEILYLQKAVEVAQASVAQLADIEQQSKQRYQVGTLSEFDWLSAQVSLANERPQLIVASNNLAIARRAFQNLIYLEDDRFRLDGSLDFTPLALDLETLIRLGLEHRAEWKQAESQVQIARDNIDIGRSDYLPEINAFANYTGNDPDPENAYASGWEWGWIAGVRASWSLLDGGARNADVKIKALELAQAEDQMRDLRRTIELEVETAWRSLNDAAESYRGAEDTVRLAERALEIARVRFDQGLATFLELNDSNLSLNRARLQRSFSQQAWHQSLAELRFATGIDTLRAAKEIEHEAP
ncbi:MAG: TolC family protein [Kiritimatiellae bacterium]|nr:TolC family protein [Kiritimatiellia bacterium]